LTAVRLNKKVTILGLDSQENSCIEEDDSSVSESDKDSNNFGRQRSNGRRFSSVKKDFRSKIKQEEFNSIRQRKDMLLDRRIAQT